MRNLFIVGLCLIVFLCVSCTKKEDTVSENMDHKGMKMPMDEDKNNE